MWVTINTYPSFYLLCLIPLCLFLLYLFPLYLFPALHVIPHFVVPNSKIGFQEVIPLSVIPDSTFACYNRFRYARFSAPIACTLQTSRAEQDNQPIFMNLCIPFSKHGYWLTTEIAPQPRMSRVPKKRVEFRSCTTYASEAGRPTDRPTRIRDQFCLTRNS